MNSRGAKQGAFEPGFGRITTIRLWTAFGKNRTMASEFEDHRSQIENYLENLELADNSLCCRRASRLRQHVVY